MLQYSKLWVALGGAAVQAVGLYFGASSAWYTLVVALVTALGVYQVSNKTV